MTGIRYSAQDCARLLGQEHLPTAEQVAVIEAPLEPLLVVAGAGSGKTETMAARVVWLVANQLVAPQEVLGLTFTRKAAGELAERLALRLSRLREAGAWTPPSCGGADALDQLPVVSTYHSYAGRIVREHGARLGIEADARLLTEAAAWQFAHEAVVAYDGPMADVVKAESTVTTAVVDLAGEMAEHLVGGEQVQDHLAAVIDALEGIVRADGSRKRAFPAEVRKVIDQLGERRQVLPLLTDYQRLKSQRDAMDFADQVAVAARLARDFPQVGAEERQRFRVVLLDEFQDTSEAQLQLLRSLFAPESGPFPVTAVGDPHQSIYGWRGASSTTLRQFRSDFGGGGEATVLPLSTSWRNDERILAAANAVAAPLRERAIVPVLPLGVRPGAGRGHVSVARLATVEEEAAHVVDWVVERRGRPGRSTAAILCRKRSQFDPVLAALEARGVPHEVVGLGGLLHTPEVADLVALLTVVQDPTRGDHLMRLLTGARCRLGAADLDGLAAWARHCTARARTATSRAVVDREPGAGDEVSLVEAIEELPPPGWTGPDGEQLGRPARERLAALALVVHQLRARTGGGLAELVADAETALGVDIEVMARPGWGTGAARAHLDAFQEVAANYDAAVDRPSLGGFLSWLDAAVEEERGLDLGWIEASPDAVQVMTVHAAKGLEWDVVAVPGLVESTFPAHSASTSKVEDGHWVHGRPTDRGWLGGLAGLPYDLRGDRAGLPRFPWDRLTDWDQACDEVDVFLEAVAERGIDEERRLAYVALTRARTDLLLAAHVWGTAKTPRITSRFLHELRDRALADRAVPWVDLPPTDIPADNPRLAEEVVVPWPPSPAPGVRAASRAAASAVTVAPDGGAQGPPGPARPWDTEIDLLLAERDGATAPTAVTLGSHLSTSDLVALATDAGAFALARRRPMPQPPQDSARVGTRFHAWVEQHYAHAAMLDPDELPGWGDDLPEEVKLDQLRRHFLESEWATRMPVELEVPVETTIAGLSVRGRIDAVFVDPQDPEGHVIVDWKSGMPPTGARARARALQLASYRLAWCRLRGQAPERVRVAFFHAATGETTWPRLDDVALVELLAAIPEANTETHTQTHTETIVGGVSPGA